MRPQPSQNPNDIAVLTASVPQAPETFSRRGSSLVSLIPPAILLRQALYKAGESKWVKNILTLLLLAWMTGITYWLFTQPFNQINAAKLTEDKRIEQLEKARANNIQLVSVLLAPLAPLATIGVAWLTIKNSQKATQENLKLTLQGQNSDRLNRAVDLLASSQPYKQTTGIHSLGVLPEADDSYYVFVESVLRDFIREKAQKDEYRGAFGVNKDTGFPDPLTASSALGKRNNTPLHLAIRTLIQMRSVRVEKAKEGDLDDLVFSDLDFTFMTFKRLHLQKIRFVDADLRGAYLGTTIENCKFYGADLRGAKFIGAKFGRVSFDSADISHADFRRTTGLNWPSFREAQSSGGTKLPDYLLDPNALGKPVDFDPSQYDPKVGWSNQYPTSSPPQATT